jgi:hypothetical protein
MAYPCAERLKTVPSDLSVVFKNLQETEQQNRWTLRDSLVIVPLWANVRLNSTHLHFAHSLHTRYLMATMPSVNKRSSFAVPNSATLQLKIVVHECEKRTHCNDPCEKKHQHIKRLQGIWVLFRAACPLLDQEAPCCVNG